MTGTTRSHFQSSFLIFLYLGALVLYLLTLIWAPIPFFRALIFEQIRNSAWLIAVGWMLLGALGLCLTLIAERKRPPLLVSILSVTCFVYLLLPLKPYYFEKPTAEAMGRDPISILVTEKEEKTPDFGELYLRHEPDLWLITSQSQVPVTVARHFSCAQELPVGDGFRSTLFAKVPCSSISTEWLEENVFGVLRVDVFVEGQGSVPLFFFRMRKGEGSEDFYFNYLVSRRLVTKLKHLRKAVLVANLEITPWSKLYGGLTHGAQFRDLAWGKGFPFSLDRVPNIKTVFLKGIRPHFHYQFETPSQ